MEEMRNYFQELTKENTIVIGETDLIISDERYEEIEDLTTDIVRKITDKFKKHKAPGMMVSEQN